SAKSSKPPDALSRMGPEESSRCCAQHDKGDDSRFLRSLLAAPAAGDRLQKADEIVGHVIDMRRVAPFELPVLAKYFARGFGHHQHGGHAQGMRHHKIARQVFEHRALPRIDSVRAEETIISLR